MGRKFLASTAWVALCISLIFVGITPAIGENAQYTESTSECKVVVPGQISVEVGGVTWTFVWPRPIEVWWWTDVNVDGNAVVSTVSTYTETYVFVGADNGFIGADPDEDTVVFVELCFTPPPTTTTTAATSTTAPTTTTTLAPTTTSSTSTTTVSTSTSTSSTTSSTTTSSTAPTTTTTTVPTTTTVVTTTTTTTTPSTTTTTPSTTTTSPVYLQCGGKWVFPGQESVVVNGATFAFVWKSTEVEWTTTGGRGEDILVIVWTADGPQSWTAGVSGMHIDTDPLIGLEACHSASPTTTTTTTTVPSSTSTSSTTSTTTSTTTTTVPPSTSSTTSTTSTTVPPSTTSTAPTSTSSTTTTTPSSSATTPPPQPAIEVSGIQPVCRDLNGAVFVKNVDDKAATGFVRVPGGEELTYTLNPGVGHRFIFPVREGGTLQVEVFLGEKQVGVVTFTAPTCPAPPVVSDDVCQNVEGVQTKVPDGFVKDAAGNCVLAELPFTGPGVEFFGLYMEFREFVAWALVMILSGLVLIWRTELGEIRQRLRVMS